MLLKKLLSSSLVLACLTSGLSLKAQEVPNAEHTIFTCKDLESIGKGENYPGATHTDAWLFTDDYVLANDIDCSATNELNPNHDTTPETTYGPDGFDMIGLDYNQGAFTGTIKGNNHTIRGLTIKSSTEGSNSTFNLGMIAANAGKISNVYFDQVYFENNKQTSNTALFVFNQGILSDINISNLKMIAPNSSSAAGLVARNMFFSTYTSGTVQNVGGQNLDFEGKDRIGGLIGEGSATGSVAVLNKLFTDNVKIVATGTNSAGIIAVFSRPTILDTAYATNVDITGDIRVGGVYGESRHQVKNVYSTGKVVGRSQTAGIAGSNNSSPGFNENYLEHSFNTVDVQGSTDTGPVVGQLNGGENFDNFYLANKCTSTTQPCNNVGAVVEVQKLTSPDFYINTVKFPEGTFDYTPLERNSYPHIIGLPFQKDTPIGN